MQTPIYLDNNATTALAPEVLEEMHAVAKSLYGNPSSVHRMGRAARTCLDQARASAARSLGASPEEVLFTSGGSESDSLAILGVVMAAPPERRHLVISTIEHPALLQAALAAEAHLGAKVTRVDPGPDGVVAASAVESAVGAQTLLVSLMLANNETGALQPVKDVSTLCQARGILLHTDAVQAVGKIPVNFESLGVDLLSISAHKFHGPRGCGLLLRRRGTPMQPLIRGGKQEQGLRPGTENVSGIAGLAKALELVVEEQQAGGSQTLRTLSERLLSRLGEALPTLTLNGPSEPALRVPNTLNLSLPGLEADPLLMGLDRLGVCVSTGSACASGSLEPSHVLRAMKLSPARLHASLRLSLSRYTTESEIDRVATAFVDVATRLS